MLFNIKRHIDTRVIFRCPGFGHYPREMPEFFSPLFFPFLRFVYLSAAPKHVRSAGAAFTGKRAGGRAGDPISLAFVNALNSDGAPRFLRLLCSEFLTHFFHCLCQMCADRADGSSFTLAGFDRGTSCLVRWSDTYIALVFRPGFTDLDVVFF